jgi:cytochrome c-type biogenesis protein CcmH
MMRHLVRRLGLLLLGVYLATGPVAMAVEPGEILSDTKLEARARAISANLRCLVCQNQSIDDSDAKLARDLRLVVRDRLTKGDTDDQIYDFVAARYGDFVLLNPPFNVRTFLLWGGPAGVFVIGLIGVIFYFKRRSGTDPAEAAPLTAEEERRLNALMDQDSEN